MPKTAQAIPIPMHNNRDEAATQGKLKKQSQFSEGLNELKYFCSKELRQYLLYWRAQKTKPNKANLYFYGTRFYRIGGA
jgi:hypothetical protein